MWDIGQHVRGARYLVDSNPHTPYLKQQAYTLHHSNQQTEKYITHTNPSVHAEKRHSEWHL